MAKIDKLFRIMVEKGASDMHLSAGAAPIIREHGSMTVVPDEPILDNAGIQELVFEILNEKQKQKFIENWELDTSYYIEGLSRFRVNVFMQRRGMGAVFRVIPTEILSASQLGLPTQVTDLVSVSRGMILVTGPTGSGKSTTLAAMINKINVEKQEHILTIEDPIEFVHENRKSLVNQREVGSHTKSFNNALKAALREDPDIILVGEMRDLETIELAMTAAETGHLVFGTLHTNSAASTVDRIIDVFPTDRQSQVRVMLSESLRGVVAQTLFKRADKKGRVAGLEVLVNTKAVSNLIREGKTFQIPSTMQTAASEGMLTFEQSLGKLVEEGKITLEQGESFLGKKLRVKEPTPDASAEAQAAAASLGSSANPDLEAARVVANKNIADPNKTGAIKKPTANGPTQLKNPNAPAANPAGGPIDHTVKISSPTAKPAGKAPANPAQGKPNPGVPQAPTGGIKIHSTTSEQPKKKEGLFSGLGFNKKKSG